MQCPVCRVELLMTERYGVEIDYCPQCRGIWLDRGELDKIVARAEQYPAEAPVDAPEPFASRVPPSGHHGGDRHDSHDSHDSRRHYGAKPHRKRSLLAELFDFD